ncbi:MAG: Undecaprenyl-phosphate mannosyltransferase [Nocardioidaceae bacterium]|nr:Undecaprenyl-phosphate mannosyltransferase [Nocardioidaceae bacterium]
MTQTALALQPQPATLAQATTVEIIVPVRNEEASLAASIRRLRSFLDHSFPFPTEICIADNGSDDGTWSVALGLTAELPGVRAVHLAEAGRGRALNTLWSCASADILAYMDVDLATDLNALLPLIAPLVSGHSDIAIGTRLNRGSRVVRGPKREILSRGYNSLLHRFLSAGFSDAQCGFKAIRADVAAELLPLVEDTGWFFDTELLVLAEHAGLRIHEVPVDWIDDPDSRVKIGSTIRADLLGMLRLSRGFASGQLDLEDVRARFARAPMADPRTALASRIVRFGLVGVISTIAYALLYVGLRPVVDPQWANVIALLATAIANTSMNRRFTFGVIGRGNEVTHQVRGLVAFGICLALTSGSLWLLHSGGSDPGRALELTVLTVANLVATVVRFSLFQLWVFRSPAPQGEPA